MASSSWCLSTAYFPSTLPSRPSQKAQAVAGSPCSVGLGRCGCFHLPPAMQHLRRNRRRGHGVVCMAPEEERITRRSPLDFPIEWERSKPGRRPDIFPQFSPMKTPLPTPLPEDPPEEDDEEEEEEEEKKEEEEEDPDKEDPDKPDKSRMQHGGWH
ncbi:splicing factor, arginine/serine-rich 19-like [Canna indica]|uniref:Splicing factor, arginine/serine-rich 19-like n=1 Tax=Canna indica TaxID=4628 RepID=A0AAQ3PWP7_9LILI|nr:splicing factor, arginine/serine-rich 19-like [Canna indica]